MCFLLSRRTCCRAGFAVLEDLLLSLIEGLLMLQLLSWLSKMVYVPHPSMGEVYRGEFLFPRAACVALGADVFTPAVVLLVDRGKCRCMVLS